MSSDLRGMSVSELLKILDEMKTIYPYSNDNTYLGNIHDPINNEPRKVELLTRDEKTGIDILMSKGVKYDCE